jgi:hypothetical protein
MSTASVGEFLTDTDTVKGQANELRRISGTARDVGNADQSELQTERSESLDHPSGASFSFIPHSSANSQNKRSNFMIFLSLTVSNVSKFTF